MLRAPGAAAAAGVPGQGERPEPPSEYLRLVQAAKRQGRERLCLVLQTICATGIRVSELRFVTVEAVRTGRATVSGKGKCREILLPGKLRARLKEYLKHTAAGPARPTRLCF